MTWHDKVVNWLTFTFDCLQLSQARIGRVCCEPLAGKICCCAAINGCGDITGVSWVEGDIASHPGCQRLQDMWFCMLESAGTTLMEVRCA